MQYATLWTAWGTGHGTGPPSGRINFLATPYMVDGRQIPLREMTRDVCFQVAAAYRTQGMADLRGRQAFGHRTRGGQPGLAIHRRPGLRPRPAVV